MNSSVIVLNLGIFLPELRSLKKYLGPKQLSPPIQHNDLKKMVQSYYCQGLNIMEYNTLQHQDQPNSEVFHAQEYTHINDIAYHVCPDLKKKKKIDLPILPIFGPKGQTNLLFVLGLIDTKVVILTLEFWFTFCTWIYVDFCPFISQRANIGPPGCHFAFPPAVLSYLRSLLPRNIVGEIREGAYEVSLVDFFCAILW